MNKRNKVIIILFLALIIISGCNTNSTFIGEKNIGFIAVNFGGWGNNEENKEEILFDYYVINYGYNEAKGIKVQCEVFDLNDNAILSEIESVGNVASQTSIYKQMAIKSKINSEEFYGFCKAISCTNCEILDERIIDRR